MNEKERITIDEILDASDKIDHLKTISRTKYSIIKILLKIEKNGGNIYQKKLYSTEKNKKITKDGKIRYEHATTCRTLDEAQILEYVSRNKQGVRVLVKSERKGKQMVKDILKDFEYKRQTYKISH